MPSLQTSGPVGVHVPIGLPDASGWFIVSSSPVCPAGRAAGPHPAITRRLPNTTALPRFDMREEHTVCEGFPGKRKTRGALGNRLEMLTLCDRLHAFRGLDSSAPSAYGRLHMGIISFIKGGVAELAIARPDAAKD